MTKASVTKAHRQLALDMVIAASEAAGDAIPDLAADAVLQGWLETGEAPPEFTLNTAASNAAAQVLADAELRGASGKAVLSEHGEGVCPDCGYAPVFAIFPPGPVERVDSELLKQVADVPDIADRFHAYDFVRAGLSLKDASTALMVSRRILEDFETERHERAKAQTPPPSEAK